MRKPYLIGVAGPSGSGKTELSRWLASMLSAPIVSLDCYYRELDHLPLHERAQTNFDQPDALDRDLLRAHLSLLAADNPIEVPVYDFTRHTRAPQVHPVEPAAFVIVEGLFALYWEQVRALLRTKVYVHTEDDLCFARRLERDVRERGRTPQSVMAQYEATVRPMGRLYVLPTRRFADVVVSGNRPLELTSAEVLAHVHAPHAGEARAAAAGDLSGLR